MNLFAAKVAALKDVSPEMEESFLPLALPAGWIRLRAPGPAYDLHSVGNPHHGLRVLFTVGREADERLWLHVSVSHAKRIPGWEDLQLVKRLFIGERFAYQVHPPQEEHFTLTGPGRIGHVLHLWAPLEGEPPLPDFLAARGGTL